MLPVVSIVGRPNVGKSTLFNRLTRSRDALVDDTPGVTRDRIYGVARVDDCDFLIVDTGGVGEESDLVANLVNDQVESVLEESDSIVFLVDATQGLTVVDEQIARKLNRINIPFTIAVNKSEGFPSELACLEFQSLGFNEPVAISAKRGSGVKQFFDSLVKGLPKRVDPLWQDPGPKVAVIGRPNVGKSTLINAICNDDRLIVSEVPGTTRDSVTVPLERSGNRFRFIDTAGVRKRSKIGETLEKLSVVKSLQAVEAAHVVVLILDGSQAITDQDASLTGLIQRAGRPVVIAVNKSDKIKFKDRNEVRRTLQRRLSFAPHHESIFISGLKRIGLAKLLKAVGKAYRSSMIEMPTPMLTRYLREAVAQTPPPLSRRRQVKLKYAHQGGKNPPVVVIHGNNVKSVPDHYRRFLEKYFRERFSLFGADVRVVFRSSRNPFD